MTSACHTATCGTAERRPTGHGYWEVASAGGSLLPPTAAPAPRQGPVTRCCGSVGGNEIGAVRRVAEGLDRWHGLRMVTVPSAEGRRHHLAARVGTSARPFFASAGAGAGKGPGC